jgi:hypothetical protein
MLTNKITAFSLRLAGLLIVVCFTASLFFCGDADCLNGNSDENCASLLCSLLNKHGAPSQEASSGDAKDCSCVCHLPIVISPAFSLGYHPITSDNTLVANLPVPSAPNRIVYHPPAAA